MYELVEGNLSNEKRTDIHEIGQRFKNDPEDHGWALRVAKVICLLEFVRDLPRTEANIAAFLVDEVGKPAPLAEVQAAVKRLQDGPVHPQHRGGLEAPDRPGEELGDRTAGLPRARSPGSGTRSPAASCGRSSTSRRSRPTATRSYRTFRIGVGVEGVTLRRRRPAADPLRSPTTPTTCPSKIDEVREESRQKAHENDLYWVFALTPEIDELVAQLQPPARWSRSTTSCGRRTRSRPTRRPASRTRRTPSWATRPACGTS